MGDQHTRLFWRTPNYIEEQAMSAVTEQAVLQALSAVRDPDLGKDVVSLGMIKNVKIDGGSVAFDFELTTPACPIKEKLEGEAREAVLALEGVDSAQVNMTANVRPMSGPTLGGTEPIAAGIKNIVLVGAGKGGVGKSTVAVNLAVGLHQLGARVGLLDADVYGPSVPIMLGIKGERPSTKDGRHLEPLSAHGLTCMSIGFLVEPEQAMIWRGPMLSQALVQFLRDVNWGELDYLVVDLPPGTGDVQLTLAQQIRASGAVLVTTPQDVALADVRKAKAMFDKVQIPVLGIVENMSYFVCPHCEQETDVFDRGGGERGAESMQIPFLGAVPLNAAIRKGGDAGTPHLISDPGGVEGKAFLEVAKQVAHQVSLQAVESAANQRPTLRIAP
jgi:ATP-binding protein involved in chromosome partitioning